MHIRLIHRPYTFIQPDNISQSVIDSAVVVGLGVLLRVSSNKIITSSCASAGNLEQGQAVDVPLEAPEAAAKTLGEIEGEGITALQKLPWEFIITREARQEWADMDRKLRWVPSAPCTLHPVHCTIAL